MLNLAANLRTKPHESVKGSKPMKDAAPDGVSILSCPTDYRPRCQGRQKEANMATTRSAPGSMPRDIQQFENKIEIAHQVHIQLSATNIYEELRKIIHQPGWTTPAERLFFQATLHLVTEQMRAVINAHQQLINASRLVGVQGQQ